MLRRFVFWYVIVCAIAGQAFGQDNRPPLKETKVLGGTIVETFVPDQPLQPIANPAFQQQQQAQPQYVVPPQQQGFPVYQQAVPYQHQHSQECGCPVCARRILSQQTRERSKTIREITTVVVVEETHPARVINTSPPQHITPSQRQFIPSCDPCGPYGRRPQYQQQGGYSGYAYRPQGISLAGLFGFNSGVYLRITHGNQRYGGYGGGGYPPPYAQSGYGYGGNQPWYGGR